MSIVSGIATASGVSSLLNAPGTNVTEDAKRVRPGLSPASEGALRIDEGVSRIVERAAQVGESADGEKPEGRQSGLAPGNARYSLFVEAVQALRLDEATAAELTPGRVAELKAAAAEVFNVRSNIPRAQRPTEVFDEQRARGAVAKAEDVHRAEVAQDPERARASVEEVTDLPGSEALDDVAVTDGGDAGKTPAPEVVKAQPVPTAPEGTGSTSEEPVQVIEVKGPSAPEPARPEAADQRAEPASEPA